MHYPLFSFTLLAVAGSANAAAPAVSAAASLPGSPAKMNILFIAADDLRTELGCYGAQQVKSPNIDRLAKTGVLFSRAYCQQATCGPSRASLLTGMRPDFTGVVANSGLFRRKLPDVVTLPQYFKQNGYYVEGMGKIFNETTGDTRQGDPSSWSVPVSFPKTVPLKWLNPENAALVATMKANPLKQGKSDYAAYAAARGPAYESADVPDNAYDDGELGDMAVDALKRLKDSKSPFFLAVGFRKPHLPFCAPKKYWDLYNPAQIKLSPVTKWPAGSPGIAHCNWEELRTYHGIPGSRLLKPEQAIKVIHGYYAAVSYLDAQIGRVLDELDKLGLAGNTIVVLWGDNGFKLSEYSAWSKCTNYELDTHIPLIIRAPGRQKQGEGQRSEALVELVDLYPTLAELCGLAVPAHCQGLSCVPVLTSPERPLKPAAFSQYTGPGCMGYTMRTDRWRYTEWINNRSKAVSARELYNLQAGGLETVNLAADPKYADTVKELSAMLAKGQGWKLCQKAAPVVTTPEKVVSVPTARFIDSLKAGKPVTIVTMGTSLTAGPWTGVMAEEWLKKDFTGTVTLHNLGAAASASKSTAGMYRSKRYVYGHCGLDRMPDALKLKPDGVFIEFTTNDAFLPYGITVAESKACLNTMVDQFRAVNPQVEIIVQTMNSCKDQPGKGVKPAASRPQLEKYVEGYRDVAKARGLLLVDNYPHWSKLMNGDASKYDRLVPDGIHPNADGYREIQLPELKRVLTDKGE